MVSINYSSREVSCKIVYYGPGLSGKTTNLQYVHAKVPKKTRGDLISLATDADRTLYFDFLPINIGAINGFATKFQLYTVPGQVFYNATRKLVLRGVDGLVFVADSQRSKRDENIESLNNLKENLIEYGYDINTLPIVLQYNKRDLPDVMSIAELQKDLNWNNLHYFEASAVKGLGVFDTLKLITKLVLNRARKTDQPEAGAALDPGATMESIPVLQTSMPPRQEGPQGEYPKVAASSTATAVATPPAAQAGMRRIEVGSAPEEKDWSMARPVPEPVQKASQTGKQSLAEIESKLHRIDNDDFEALKQQTPGAVVSGENESSRSQFADTFEVPKVVGMQKSLKVKKKKKRFFLFRWFGGDTE
jgi:hypothetical protein